MIFTLLELFDAVIMCLVIGFIFKDIFQIRRVNPEGVPIAAPKFDMKPMWMSIAATAPAILIHELSHKLVAIAYGLQATFHAQYFGLGIGIFLKLIGSPFIFFIPAYVETSGVASNIPMAMVAFAGPMINLLLWITPKIILTKNKKMSKEWKIILLLTQKINGFLFILNMLPIPGFDGFNGYISIFKAFSG